MTLHCQNHRTREFPRCGAHRVRGGGELFVGLQPRGSEMVPNLARSTVGPPDHCFSKHALTKWARRRPASAAAPTTRARAAGTSSRPASASFVRRDLATGACSTVKRVPYDEPEDVEDWNARNLPYTSPASDPHGSPLPQFRALSSGFLNYKERELMSRARSPGDAPPRQPDCVRAWTSSTPEPPPSVSEVARTRGCESEELFDPLALEGRDQRGRQFARVKLREGEKARPRPRRSDRMAAVLAAKDARDRAQTRRLGQGDGHEEAAADQPYFRATHHPPGQPKSGFPREHLIRSREESVWGRQHRDILKQRKAWEAKDKLLFEKNRLRKMVTDKLTQENNDKKQQRAAAATSG